MYLENDHRPEIKALQQSAVTTSSMADQATPQVPRWWQGLRPISGGSSTRVRH